MPLVAVAKGVEGLLFTVVSLIWDSTVFIFIVRGQNEKGYLEMVFSSKELCISSASHREADKLLVTL